MKIYDFDAKFFEYAQTWMALHPGLTEKQVEDSYNEIMMNFLNAPAKWLDGQKPGEYFNYYTDPKDLMKLFEEYHRRDVGVAEDRQRPEEMRASAIAMLRDIGTDAPREMYIDLVSRCGEANELSEMASDILCASDETVVDELLKRYEAAPEYAQMLILDICCNFPGRENVYELCVDKLRNRPEERAFYASLLEKLGDPRALETLEKMLKLTDLNYLDYIEIRNAVESLGGDPGEERTFYGDPDYEAMRNL